MADFPSTTPPVIQEHIDYIRFWLGDITDTTISDLNMATIIAMNVGKYGEDNCKIVYYSTVDILRWLIRESAKGQSGSTGSGAISKIRERAGKREKEVTYDVGTSSGSLAGWDKVLDDLLANPSTIGCNPVDSGTDGENTGSVIIGVNTEKYTFSSPYRQNLNPYSKKSSPWS